MVFVGAVQNHADLVRCPPLPESAILAVKTVRYVEHLRTTNSTVSGGRCMRGWVCTHLFLDQNLHIACLFFDPMIACLFFCVVEKVGGWSRSVQI